MWVEVDANQLVNLDHVSSIVVHQNNQRINHPGWFEVLATEVTGKSYLLFETKDHYEAQGFLSYIREAMLAGIVCVDFTKFPEWVMEFGSRGQR